MPATRPRPDGETVAELLDADPEHVIEFVEHHPDPTPEAVAAAGIAGLAPGELGPDERHCLAAWIQARKDHHRDGPNPTYWVTG